MPPRAPTASTTALAAAALLALAGCGGASGPTKAPTLGGASSPQSLHAVLLGENHTPTVNRPWRYTVTVRDAQNRKLSGTETTHYTFNGLVVGTEHPTNVRFAGGVYRDTVEFPAAAVGYPLVVQAVVHTSRGSATVDWPVKVHR